MKTCRVARPRSHPRCRPRCWHRWKILGWDCRTGRFVTGDAWNNNQALVAGPISSVSTGRTGLVVSGIPTCDAYYYVSIKQTTQFFPLIFFFYSPLFQSFSVNIHYFCALLGAVCAGDFFFNADCKVTGLSFSFLLLSSVDSYMLLQGRG